jgi:hypothetical protein
VRIYRVGGSVRDELMGLPAGDRDWVVVGATPDDMVAAGYMPVGRDFPVFLHPETHEEYALARTERKTAPGYRGFVFHADASVTLEQDLQRRDLTINAIARDDDGTLIDPCGGQADIAAHVLRHVSPAFAEDPVRILRLARFAARFDGYSVAPETCGLMRDMVIAGEADALVAERVWQELSRGLMAPRPSRMIEVLRDCGALAVVLREVDALFGVPQPEKHHPEIDAGIHLMQCLDWAAAHDASLATRWALLVHDLGKGTTSCAARNSQPCAACRRPTGTMRSPDRGLPQTHVAVDRSRDDATARRALQVALLYQVGLDHAAVLDGVARFADRRCKVVHADRAAIELVDDGAEQLAVHQVQSEAIHVQHGQCGVGHRARDGTVCLHLCVVAAAAQQAIRDTRRAARAARDFDAAGVIHRTVEQPRRASHDQRQFVGGVELEPGDDAEAVAQRIGQHAGARRCTDQRERRQVELDRTRSRAFADHDVDLEILQRRVEDFLHHRTQAVDFVDEQHVVRFEVAEDGGKVAGALQHRAGGLTQIDPHFGRDDVRQCGLAETRRAEQQHVVERFVPRPCRGHEDVELFADLGLADVFIEPLRAQRALQRVFLHAGRRGGDQSLGTCLQRIGMEHVDQTSDGSNQRHSPGARSAGSSSRPTATRCSASTRLPAAATMRFT